MTALMAKALPETRVNDLWIAAIALDLGVDVVTQSQGFLRLQELGGPGVILV
jgi:predicted nucleic acid-binding protein